MTPTFFTGRENNDIHQPLKPPKLVHLRDFDTDLSRLVSSQLWTIRCPIAGIFILVPRPLPRSA